MQDGPTVVGEGNTYDLDEDRPVKKKISRLGFFKTIHFYGALFFLCSHTLCWISFKDWRPIVPLTSSFLDLTTPTELPTDLSSPIATILGQNNDKPAVAESAPQTSQGGTQTSEGGTQTSQDGTQTSEGGTQTATDDQETAVNKDTQVSEDTAISKDTEVDKGTQTSRDAGTQTVADPFGPKEIATQTDSKPLSAKPPPGKRVITKGWLNSLAMRSRQAKEKEPQDGIPPTSRVSKTRFETGFWLTFFTCIIGGVLALSALINCILYFQMIRRFGIGAETPRTPDEATALLASGNAVPRRVFGRRRLKLRRSLCIPQRVRLPTLAWTHFLLIIIADIGDALMAQPSAVM